MSVLITYNTLFEVKILHHYFLNRGNDCYDTMTGDQQASMMMNYSCRNFLNICPTEATARMLKSHHALFRLTDTGIIIGIETQNDLPAPGKIKPFIPFGEEDTLTFLAEITDMNFLNYTALPLSGNEGKVYLFQNSPSYGFRILPSLSAVPPLQLAGATYLPGDMVVDSLSDPNKLFIARVKTKKETSDTDDWLEEKKSDHYPMCYVNGAERISLCHGILNYKVKTAGIQPTATLKSESGDILPLEGEILAGDFKTLQYNLQNYPEGLYSVDFENTTPPYSDKITFFLLHQRTTPFGIIRLTIKGDGSDYSITGTDGELLSPVFHLRFRNRATHWKYIGKKYGPASFTSMPLPLTSKGVIDNVQAPGKNGALVDDLPNPTSLMIKTDALTDPDSDKYYTEIHIN